jgi:osmotically-inducible protein OsmY
MKDDEEIRDDVLAELEFQPQVDATAIGVAVRNGIVTLSGHVASYAEKLAAEAAAKRVKGVRGLAQEINVRLPSNVRRDAAELAGRARDILAWSVNTPRTGVTVECVKGLVTLSGEVDLAYQRDDAERAVRGLAGVVGVVNRITLSGGARPRDVQDRIKRALSRNAELDARSINVIVDGGKVTLAGRVSAWSERRLAENAAWAVPGVYQVIDDLTVA